MLEPVANIKTLLIEGSCSSINSFHRVIAKFYGRHHELVDRYNMAVLKFISDLMASVEAYKAFKTGFSFSLTYFSDT